MRKIVLVLLLAVVLTGAFYFAYKSKNNKNNAMPENNVPIAAGVKNFSHLAIIRTNFGEIKFKTYDADAPKTVENFVTLANKKFYDGLTFHRVISGFMIQGGDPNCGSTRSPQALSGSCGTGGPGYMFEDELNPETESYKNGYKEGTLAMANSGVNTNGSQFFIMDKDTLLPHNYTIFGQVIEGQDVVRKIASQKTGPNDRPLDAVTIESAVILDISQ